MKNDALNYNLDGIEAVYYFDKELRLCPVKKYLERYILRPGDKIKQQNRKIKILSDLDNKIKYIIEKKGIFSPPITVPLHGYDFHEIKQRKNKNTVIRVLLFRHKSKIVLLDAFEKPSHYTKNCEKSKVEKNYKKAEKYYKKFKLNPKSYEKYE
jgi:hypothetical protein